MSGAGVCVERSEGPFTLPGGSGIKAELMRYRRQQHGHEGTGARTERSIAGYTKLSPCSSLRPLSSWSVQVSRPLLQQIAGVLQQNSRSMYACVGGAAGKLGVGTCWGRLQIVAQWLVNQRQHRYSPVCRTPTSEGTGVLYPERPSGSCIPRPLRTSGTPWRLDCRHGARHNYCMCPPGTGSTITLRNKAPGGSTSYGLKCGQIGQRNQRLQKGRGGEAGSHASHPCRLQTTVNQLSLKVHTQFHEDRHSISAVSLFGLKHPRGRPAACQPASVDQSGHKLEPMRPLIGTSIPPAAAERNLQHF